MIYSNVRTDLRRTDSSATSASFLRRPSATRILTGLSTLENSSLTRAWAPSGSGPHLVSTTFRDILRRRGSSVREPTGAARNSQLDSYMIKYCSYHPHIPPSLYNRPWNAVASFRVSVEYNNNRQMETRSLVASSCVWGSYDIRCISSGTIETIWTELID
jgi:hypothetical protein